MEKLNLSQDSSILPLPAQFGNAPTFVYSALFGVLPGEIWIDNRDQPSSVLVSLDMGLYYVGGESQYGDDFIDYLSVKIKERKQRFTLFSSSLSWNDCLVRSLDEDLQLIPRLAYQFQPDNVDHPLAAADSATTGYFIKKIDHETISRSQEFSEGYYREYWGSISHFEQHGFGYAIVYKEEIVAECTSIFSNKVAAEIDIVTSPEHRGRGLGLLCAQAFIEEAVKRNATPRWDCHLDNTASKNMARWLGFVNPVEYSVLVRKGKK